MTDLTDHFHFIGIGGAGMSAIAKVLLEMGCQVSGSDLHASEATARLERLGAKVYIGHRAENLTGDETVIVSSAVPSGNVELLEAQRLGLAVLQRAEMLGRLMADRYSIAVAGTHGKTTTTSMIALILERAGLDPTVLIGGELNDIGGNAKLGRGPHLVAEADESDRSFLRLWPTLAVVTNIECDHLENYGSLDRIYEAFRSFARKVPRDGAAVICVDDPTARRLTGELDRRVITYSVREPADYQATDIVLNGTGSAFAVRRAGEELGRMELAVPGVHNVSDALAALAAGTEVGLDFPEIAAALASFTGAQRRFQTLGTSGGIRVVTDYGHHPTEVRATLAAARQVAGGRVICLFQPHRYTRTKFLEHEFGTAFTAADDVAITEIYSAGEQPIAGVSADLIVRSVERQTGRRPAYVPDKEDLVAYALEVARPGDIVLAMGAGDINRIGEQIAGRLAAIHGDGTVAPVTTTSGQA